jgi:hypothetical protein
MNKKIPKKTGPETRAEDEPFLAWELMAPADEDDKGLWVGMATGELPGFGSHMAGPPFNAPFGF